MTNVHIRLAETFADLVAVGTLLDEVWGATTVPVVPMRMLRALHQAGALVAMAEDELGLVGACLAFHGQRGDERLLHSKVTGVRARGRGAGVAVALKLDQRRRALDLGIELVEWTYDPLVVRNGVFNLNKLAGVITGYETDFYGPMTDALNRGHASDRCIVDWRLTDPRVVAAVGALETGERRPLSTSIAPAVLTIDQDGGPKAAEETEATQVLVSAPRDIEALRASSPDLAAAWSSAMRAELGRRVTAGWTVTSVVDGAYLLSSTAPD